MKWNSADTLGFLHWQRKWMLGLNGSQESKVEWTQPNNKAQLLILGLTLIHSAHATMGMVWKGFIYGQGKLNLIFFLQGDVEPNCRESEVIAYWGQPGCREIFSEGCLKDARKTVLHVLFVSIVFWVGNWFNIRSFLDER